MHGVGRADGAAEAEPPGRPAPPPAAHGLGEPSRSTPASQVPGPRALRETPPLKPPYTSAPKRPIVGPGRRPRVEGWVVISANQLLGGRGGETARRGGDTRRYKLSWKRGVLAAWSCTPLLTLRSGMPGLGFHHRSRDTRLGLNQFFCCLGSRITHFSSHPLQFDAVSRGGECGYCSLRFANPRGKLFAVSLVFESKPRAVWEERLGHICKRAVRIKSQS